MNENNILTEADNIAILISDDSESTDMEITSKNKKEVVGVVTNCDRLNIRKFPKPNAEILCDVAALSNLLIDLNNSTNEWLSVCTETGIEGYCMKKFVVVKR